MYEMEKYSDNSNYKFLNNVIIIGKLNSKGDVLDEKAE